MSNPLFKKLGLKGGQKVILQNFPDNYFDLLITAPEVEECLVDEKADFIHVFETEESKLLENFSELIKKMNQSGMIWVSWPKKTSNIKTDLNYHVVKRIAASLGLVDVKVCAVDETWTATKYVIPLKDRK